MNMKAIYLLVLPLLMSPAILSCGGDDDEPAPAPVEKPTPAPEPGGNNNSEPQMTVMSFNIRCITGADVDEHAWDARRAPCISMFRDVKPDIAGLQEVRPAQHDYLVSELGDTYGSFCASDNGVTSVTSVATMIIYLRSRFELVEKGHFWLSTTPDVESAPGWGATDTEVRTAVWVRLHDKKYDKDIYMCDAHLPYKAADNDARSGCTQLIVNRMKEKAGNDMPVIVTGDMNASWNPDDARRPSIKNLYDWMSGARQTADVVNPDVYSLNRYGETAKVTENDNIDHIFYRNVQPFEFKVIDSPNYGVKYISDHYPVILTLAY